MPRYILNVKAKVAHERPTDERCNADDVFLRRDSDHVPPGYSRCQWCPVPRKEGER